MNCRECGNVYSLQAGPVLPECRHLGQQLAIFYTSLTNEARQLELKLQHWLVAALVIYYLVSRGEAGLKNFMHAFCKANSSLGGIQSSVWEKMSKYQTLMHFTVFLCPAQFNPAKTGKETTAMWIAWRRTRNTDILAVFSFTVFWFISFVYFLVVIFYLWQMKVALASSNSRQRSMGISFRLPCHVYFRNRFRGVSVSCIIQFQITPHRQALFIFSQARKLRSK